jgi:hypothetical protein
METPVLGLGAIFSPDDDRDYEPERFGIVAGAVPVAYRAPNNGPVLNQGDLPQCTAYAAAGLEQSFEYAEDATFPTFNETDLFAKAGGTSQGAVMRNVLNVWVKTGILATGGRVANPERLLLGGYARLNSADQIYAAVFANGVGAYFGVNWQHSWREPLSGGVLPKPDSTEGGHALKVCGFDQNMLCPDGSRGAILLQNSWGNWGARGFCWLPVSYLHSVAWEAWSVTDQPNSQLTVAPFVTPRKVSVTGDVPCWSPRRPSAPAKVMHFGKRHSVTQADATVAISWVGLQPAPPMSGGGWIRLTGANAGLYVRAAANVVLS